MTLDLDQQLGLGRTGSQRSQIEAEGSGSEPRPTRADLAAFKVEFENAKAQVLRFHYGAHKKSVMHSHPDSVVVPLNQGTVKFTFPDGKKQDSPARAGQSAFTPATVHNPENMGDGAMDGILVELKGGSAMK